MRTIRKLVPVASTPAALSRALLACASLVLASCGGTDDEDDTPPPPTERRVDPDPGIAAGPRPGQPVMVTVVANSTPPGALVVGGGRQLGVTPLQTQVPVPAPAPGQVQTFGFTFQLEGYQAATINASPVNNTISITAALAPSVQEVLPEEVGTADPNQPSVGGGRVLQVAGRGGGAIYDNHTTTGYAEVDQPCEVAEMTVTLSGRHSYYGDLHISLRGPAGGRYSLAAGGQSNPFRTHTVRRAVGAQAQGRWTLTVSDRLDADSGNLSAWSMRITCR
jgi:hypothetical protein